MKSATIIFLAIAGWITSAWGIMLVVGILHNDYWNFIPPMGFNTAFTIVGVTLLIAVVTTIISTVINAAFDN